MHHLRPAALANMRPWHVIADEDLEQAVRDAVAVPRRRYVASAMAQRFIDCLFHIMQGSQILSRSISGPAVNLMSVILDFLRQLSLDQQRYSLIQVGCVRSWRVVGSPPRLESQKLHQGVNSCLPELMSELRTPDE